MKNRSIEELIEILAGMETILRRYGYNGQADEVSRAIACARSGDGKLRECLVSAAFWGGAGSVWEVYLDEQFSDSRQQKADMREFDAAVVRLAQWIKDNGWDSPRVRQVAGYAKDWNPFRNPRITVQFLYVVVPIALLAVAYALWDRW